MSLYSSNHNDRQALFFTWVLFTIFVVYGSLVPLNYHPMPLTDALERFAEIPYLDLGMESRQDWVANLVLYIPISFGAAMLIIPIHSPMIIQIIACIIITVFCSSLAVAVEFTQLYFPGRTVSQNDIIAELLGSAGGTLLFLAAGKKLMSLWHDTKIHGEIALKGMLTLYLFFYIAYAIFPYDFLLSVQEIKIKLDSGKCAFLYARGVGFDNIVYFLMKPLVELIAFIPAGILFALINKNRKIGWITLFASGLFGGLAIEVMQFFTATGISQGLSVILKAFGFVAGYALFYLLSYFYCGITIQRIRFSSVVLSVVYIIALYFVNWHAKGSILPEDQVIEKIQHMVYIPFYYHYRLSESVAMFSAAAYFIMYIPAGILSWCYIFSYDRFSGSVFKLMALLTAVILSLFFETGKFFLSETRPDFSNVILACAGSLLGYFMVSWAWEQIRVGVSARNINFDKEYA